MLKFLVSLTTLLCLPLFAGDSSGNGGNYFEGHLQRLARTSAIETLRHDKNKNIYSDKERESLIALIEGGVPFRVVKSVPGNAVNGLVTIKEKGREKLQVHWDEKTIHATTKGGTIFPDELIQDIIRNTSRYGQRLGVVPNSDEDGKLSRQLYVPPSSESKLLPSAEYRYDIHRRLKEFVTLERNIIWMLEQERPVDQSKLAEYQAKLKVAESLLTYKFKELDEDWAINLDYNERILLAEHSDLVKRRKGK